MIESHDVTATLVAPDGATFTLHGSSADDSIMKHLVASGMFEPEVMTVMAELVGREGVALDVGANIGVLTVVLARLMPDGVVYAFEPGEEAAGYLRKNLEANALENVVVVQAAVLDKDADAVLQVVPDGAGWSFVSDRLSSSQQETVRALRLDDWVETQSLKSIDLVKLDIEGSELLALAGAGRLLAAFRPNIIAEYNPLIVRSMQGDDPLRLYRVLRAYSKHVYALCPGGRVVRITSARHLEKLVSRHGLLNLLSAPKRLRPSRGPETFRSFARGLVHHVALTIRDNHWRSPNQSWLTTYKLAVTAPPTLELVAGSEAAVRVSVQNKSRLWMSSAFPETPVYCGHRWFTTDGVAVGRTVLPGALEDTDVTAFPTPLGPGRSADLACRVTAPEQIGEFELRFGIVQRHFLWIDDVEPGSGARVLVRVR